MNNSNQNVTSSRTPKNCARCRNHGLSIPLNGHKRYCAYRFCRCEPCQTTAKRQRDMALQTFVRRAAALDEARGISSTTINASNDPFMGVARESVDGVNPIYQRVLISEDIRETRDQPFIMDPVPITPSSSQQLLPFHSQYTNHNIEQLLMLSRMNNGRKTNNEVRPMHQNALYSELTNKNRCYANVEPVSSSKPQRQLTHKLPENSDNTKQQEQQSFPDLSNKAIKNSENTEQQKQQNFLDELLNEALDESSDSVDVEIVESDASNNSEMIILPESYPSVVMSENQFKEIFNHLNESMDNLHSDVPLPQFHSYKYDYGYLSIKCKNNKSAEFLINSVTSFAKLPKLIAISQKKMPPILSTYTNDFTFAPDKFLKRLPRQNDEIDLDTTSWKIFNIEKKNHGFRFLIMMDKASATLIESKGGVLFYSLSTIKLVNIMNKEEN